MKKLHLCYYGNVVKAFTDRGPSILAPPFKNFLVAYDDWNDMTNEAKQQHIKSFMPYKPSANDLLEVLPDRQVPASTKTQSTTASQNEEETTSLVEKEEQFTIPATAEELSISEEKLRLDILREIFIKAEEIANSPNGVTTAASSDERMRTVKSSTSDQPLIISPNPRNRNLLQCKCKTSMWHLICKHALAAAFNLGITFYYLVEVKKKILTSRKSKGFTKAVNMNSSITEKGLKKSQIQNKCNKEMKSAASERQRFAAVSVSSKAPKGSSISDQVISTGDIQLNIQPFSTGLILPNTQPIPSSISYTVKQAADS